MDRAACLVLFALLTAFVGNAAASCRKVANEDMSEYLCEGGHPSELATVPETTEKLRIVRMPLRSITADTFSRFGGNLLVLSCSQCEIDDIDADAFRRLVNLQQLSLDNNRLTTVRASWFEDLDELTYLDLNYNEIRDIEDGVYTNLPSLVDLRISGNRLRCLNLDEMSRLRELKRIFLSENSEFACPHAVGKFLENQGVDFVEDPEWRRLTSDTIEVHVPPRGYVEEDREIVPAYRERLHPDRKPPPESEEPYATRDKTFFPAIPEHRARHRKPSTTTVRPWTPKRQDELPLPRVEPIYPDTSSSQVPSESSSHQVIPYTYSTSETSRAQPSEDIRMSGTDGPSRTEHILMYPPYPTYETTPYWSYPTSERTRVPPVVPLSEDNGIAGTDMPPPPPTYPPYIPTRETMPYPSYPTEKSRVTGSSEGETVGESGRSSQAGNTMTYPLYATTSDGIERTPHGSIQVTRPSDISDMIIWSTDDSIEHSVDSPWVHERHEQSRRPAEETTDRTTWSTKTPYYGHDPRKMIVEETSYKPNVEDDLIIAVDPVEYDRPQTTTASGMHYVRPSSPELMHSPSTDEFYQAPYYESTVTVHPPLQNYQDGNGRVTVVRPITTAKPTECPENSAPKTRPAAALVTFIAVIVLGHAFAERF
ncbi:PREDICTED: mediator of DNA damage checkpoint protein 1-like [Wasmannia auropunctata]|uniref:mediator of DNA damage checkpoint protein 1-like n=1 Tax=Wasmannia auropunctata TaxID=64793 RepID=UPI0005EDC3AE|nr:PREDICTED: mediator of DNA damage checkpoint protein 1-like [Wasmannia auropunctata]